MFDITGEYLKKRMTWKQITNYFLYRVSKKKRPYLKYCPVNLIFAVTDHCTYRCNMCHLHSPLIRPEAHFNVKKPDIFFDLFSDVVRTFPHAMNASFVGTGEPLLHKDIYKMIAFAHKRRMVTRTITNGFLLGDQADTLCSSRLDHISISINGYCKDDFHRMTGMKSDNFDAVLENVAKLVMKRNRQRHHLKVAVSFILDTTNYKYADKMVKIASDLKVDECDFQNFISSNTNGFRAEERSLFHSKELEQFFSELAIPPNVKVGFPRLIRRDRRINGCHFLFSTLRIDSEGNTGSCGGSLLNLNGHSKYTEANVWNNKYLTTMRELFLFRKEELPEPCYVCPHNY